MLTDAQVLQKLEDAQGAILGWQLNGADQRAFASAKDRNVIQMDGDLYVHPDAEKHLDCGDPDRPFWTMPHNVAYRALEKRGFEVVNTGGGCTAWSIALPDGGYCWITCTDDPSHDFEKGETVAICFYNADGEEWVGFYDCKVDVEQA